MTKGICRVGDTVTGTCQASASGHPRTFTGTWTTGSGVVTSEGKGVIRQNDTGMTDCGHVFKANGGSSAYSADGLKLQMVGDPVTVVLGGTGVSVTGSAVSIAE